MRRAGALIYDKLQPGAKRLLTVLGVASMARAATFGRRLSPLFALNGVRRLLSAHVETDQETLNGLHHYLPEQLKGARTDIRQLRSSNAPAQNFLNGVRLVLRAAAQGAYGRGVQEICARVDWDRAIVEDEERFRNWFFDQEPGQLGFKRQTIREHGGDNIGRCFDLSTDQAALQQLSPIERRMLDARRKTLSVACLLSPDAVASSIYGHDRQEDNYTEHGLYLVIREARRGGLDGEAVELHRDLLWLYEASDRDETRGPLAKPITRALYLPWRSDATNPTAADDAQVSKEPFSEPNAFALVKAPPNFDTKPNLIAFWGDGTPHRSPHRIALTTTDLADGGGRQGVNAHVGFLTGMHGDMRAPAAWRVLIARPNWEECVDIERDLVSFTKDKSRADYLREIGATKRLIKSAPAQLARTETPEARMFLNFKAMMSSGAPNRAIFQCDDNNRAALLNMTTYLHSDPPRGAFDRVRANAGIAASFDEAVAEMLTL